MKTQTHIQEAGLLVATESAVFRYEGADVAIVAGQTRVREGHPILKGREHLFKPITAHYEIESATNAPGERRGA